MYGKKQWRGREVEGRYSDIMTFFIRDLIDGKVNVTDVKQYPHYYFTIEYMQKCFENSIEIQVIREIINTTNCVVTIEANSDTI